MKNYGLHAQFSFQTTTSTFADLERVMSGLSGIEKAVQSTAATLAETDLGRQLVGGVGKVRSSVSGLGSASATATRQLVPMKKELRALKAEARNIDFGDLTDKKQFSGAKKEIENYTIALAKLEQQVQGNAVEERELSAALKTQISIAEERLSVADLQRKAAMAATKAGQFGVVNAGGDKILNFTKEIVGDERLTELSQSLGTVQKLANNLDPSGITAVRNSTLNLATALSIADTQVASVYEDLAGAGKNFATAIDPLTHQRFIDERKAEVEQILKNKAALDITTDKASQLNVTLGSIYKNSLGQYAGGIVELNARAGSAINDLADKLEDVKISADDVVPIMNVLMNTIGDAKNFPVDQVAAFSAAVASLGTVEPEAAGSFFNRLMPAMAKNTEGFAKALEMSSDKFDQLVNRDKYQVVLDIAQKYKSIQGDIQKGSFLKGLGIGSAQDQKLIQGIANNLGVFIDARKVAQKGFTGLDDQGNLEGQLSVSAEFGRVSQTAAFQSERFTSAVAALKHNLGLVIQDALIPFMKVASDLIGVVLKATQASPGLTKAIVLGVVVFGGLASAVGAAGLALFSYQQAAATASIATTLMGRTLVPLTGFFETALAGFSGPTNLVTFLGSLKPFFLELVAPLGIVTTQIQAFGATSMAFMVSPVGMAVVGIGLLLTLLEQATPGVSVLGTAMGAIAAPIGFVTGLLKGFTKTLLEFVGGTTGKTFQILVTPFKLVGDAISQATKIFAHFEATGEEVGKNLANFILKPFKTVGAAITLVWSFTIGAIASKLQGFVRFVRGIGRMLLGGLAEASPGPTYHIRMRWQETIDFLKSILSPFVNFVSGIGAGIVKAFLSIALILHYNTILPLLSVGSVIITFAKNIDSLLVFMQEAGAKIAQAWNISEITGQWIKLIDFAKDTGNKLVGFLNHGSADIVKNAWLSSMSSAGNALMAFFNIANQLAAPLVQSLTGVTEIISSISRETNLIQASFDKTIDKEGRFAARRQAVMEPLQALATGIATAYLGLVKVISQSLSWIDRLTERVKTNIDFFGALALGASVLAQLFVGLILPGTALAQVMAGIPAALARFGPALVATTIATGNFAKLEDQILGIPRALEKLTIQISAAFGIEPPEQVLRFFQVFETVAVNLKKSLADFNTNVLHPLLDGLLNFVLVGTLFKPTGIFLFQAPPIFQGILDAVSSAEFKSIFGFTGEILVPIFKALSGIARVIFFIGSAIVTIPIAVFAEMASRAIQAAKGATQLVTALGLPIQVSLSPIATIKMAIEGISTTARSVLTEVLPSIINRGISSIEVLIIQKLGQLPLGQKVLVPVFKTAFIFLQKHLPNILNNKIFDFIVGVFKRYFRILAQTFPITSFTDIFLLLPRLAAKSSLGVLMAFLSLAKGAFQVFSLLNPFYLFSQYSKFEKDLVPLLTPFDTLKERINKILSSAIFGNLAEQAKKATGALSVQFQAMDRSLNIVAPKIKRLIAFITPGIEAVIQRMSKVQSLLSPIMEGPLAGIVRTLSIMAVRLQFLGGAAVVFSTLYILLKAFDNQTLDTLATVELFGVKLSWLSIGIRVLRNSIIPLTDTLITLAHSGASSFVGLSYILNHLGKSIIPTTLTSMGDALYEVEVGFGQKIAAPMWAVNITKALNVVIRGFKFFVDAIGFSARLIKGILSGIVLGIPVILLGVVDAVLIGAKVGLQGLIAAVQVVGGVVDTALGHLMLYLTAISKRDGAAINKLVQEDIGKPLIAFTQWLQSLVLAGIGKLINGIKSLALIALNWIYSGMLLAGRQAFKFGDALLHPVHTIKTLAVWAGILAAKVGVIAIAFLTLTQFIPNLASFTGKLQSVGKAATIVGNVAEVALGGAGVAATTASFAVAPLITGLLAMGALVVALGIEYKRGFKEIHAAIAALETPIASVTGMFFRLIGIITGPINIPLFDKISQFIGFFVDLAKKVIPIAILAFVGFQFASRGPIEAIRAIGKAIVTLVQGIGWLIASLLKFGKTAAANPFAQLIGKQAVVGARSVSPVGGFASVGQKDLAKADIAAVKASLAFRKQAEGEIRRVKKESESLFIRGALSESAVAREQYGKYVETVEKRTLFGVKKVHQLTQAGKVAQEKLVASDVLSENRLRGMSRESGLEIATEKSGTTLSVPQLRKIASQNQPRALRDLIEDFDAVFAAQAEMERMDVKQMEVSTLKILGLPDGIMGVSLDKAGSPKVTTEKKLADILELEVSLDDMRQLGGMTDLIKELGGEAGKTSVRLKDLTTKQLKKLAEGHGVTPQLLPEIPSKGTGADYYKKLGIEEVERQLIAIQLLHTQELPNVSFKHSDMSSEILTAGDMEPKIDPIRDASSKLARIDKLNQLLDGLESFKGFAGYDLTPSTQAGVMVPKMQEELTAGISAGTSSFQYAKYGVIKDLLEHQRDRILAEMGEITQTITVQEAKTAEGIAAEIPKFKRKGLFECVKAGIARLGQAIRGRVTSGIQGIKTSEFVQSQAAQQSISKEEALAKKRRELIEQAIANMGMKPSQDLEVLSTLGASASKRETSGRIADFVNPANIDKIIPHIKLPTGHTLKEVTELFKGVKKERLKQMAARNGLEPYLEVLASNLNMGYETLLNQIKEGTTGIAGSLTQAVNQFMADLELSPSVGRTESTYIKGLKGLADQLKDKTQGEIINFLKKNKPSLQGRSYYEYLNEAIQNRFDLDPSDVSKIDKVIASSLTPSKRVNPNHNTAQLKRFYQLLKEGGMIDKDPERLWGNLMAKYSAEVNRINDGIVKYEDKTPLVTALKEYLKRKGKVDEDSFNSLIQGLAQGKSFQGTFIKLIETGYVEELKTLEAAEKHFGFKPAIHETQTEQFAAKQKVLQGYLNSPDILFAIDKGDISKDDINNLLMELAKKANIELDQLINPLISSEELKSARDLRIKKVSELTGKLKTTPEAVLDPAQLKFIYSGKFYQIADVEIQEIATLLGYADKGSNTAKEQLIKDLSTIELLKSRSGAKAKLGRLAVRLLKIPLNLFGITAISKATQYTHEVNQVLSASVRIEQNRIAQEQKHNDLLLKQKEIRQKALDAAIIAAKLSKKSFIDKLTPKLQEIVKNFIYTGNFIEKIPEEAQQKLAKAMGEKLETSKLPELHKALAEYEENYTDTTGIERTRQVDLANPFAKFMKQQGQLTEKQMRSIQSVLGELGINIEGSKIADLEKSFKKFRGKLQPKDLQSVLQTLLKSGGFDKELELKSSEIQEIANALKIDTTKLKEIGEGKFELDTINRLKFQIATFFETLFQGFKYFRKNFRAKAANIKLFGLGDKVFTPFLQNIEKTVTSVNQRFKQASLLTTKLPVVKQFLTAKAKQQTDSGKSLQTLLENAEFQGSPQVFAEKYTERVGSVLAAKDLKMPEELIHKAMAAIFSPSEKGLREDLKAATAGMKNQDLLAEVITEAFGDTLKLTTQEAQKYLEPKGLSAKTTRPLIAYLASEIPDLLKQIGDLSLKAIRATFNDMIKAVGAPINRFIGRAARGAAETAAIAVNQLRGFFPSQTKGVGKYITKLEELLLNTGLGVQKYLETQASALSTQRSVIRSTLGNSFKLMFFGFKLIVGAVKQTSKLIFKAGRRLTPMVKGINWKELFGGYRKLIGKVIGGVRHLFTKVTPVADRAAQTIAKDVAATRSVDLRATAKFPVLGSPESGAKISTPPQREQPGYPFPVIPESRYSYRSPALPTPARLEEPPTTTEPKLSESQRKPGILQKINKLISDLFMQPAEPYTIRSKDALRDKSGAKLFLGSSPPAPPASPVPPTPPAPRVPQITPTAQVGQFIVPPAGQGLPTAPVKELPTSKNPLERAFGAISDALIKTARKITTPAVKEVTVKRLKRIPVDPSRILPPVKEEGSPPMPDPSKLGTRLEVSEEAIKPLFSAIPAAITEKARSATAKLALYFANSAMRSRDAWAKAQADITNTHWTHLVSRARIVGTFLVESLNHGAADVTAQAWDRTEQSIEQNMHAMHNSAAHTGQQMAGEMKTAATSTHKSFLGLVGRAGMGIGKTGFAAFGALSAAGFAAQSAVSSLSTMGLVSEESGEKLNKFLEVFTLIGTIGSIVAPMLELVGSLFGTIGSLAALVLNPVTLTIAAVVGGVILINAALKKLFGIDLLEPIFTQIQQPFAGAVTSVEGMWAGFVERYGEKLLPIVQPAIDIMTQIQGVFAGAIAQIQLAWTGFASWFTTLPLVQSAIAIAQGLIAALNCHPTEAIPEAWAGAVAQITGFLSGLPIIGNFIGGKLTEAFNPGTIFGGLFEGVGKFIEVAKSSGLGNFFGSQLNALQKFLGGMKTIKKEKIATVATEQTTSYAKEFETAQKLASAQGNQRASEYLKSVSTATGAQLTPSQFQKVATGKDIEVVQAPASLAAGVLSNLTAVDPTTVSALKGLESTEVGKTIPETSDVVAASGRYLQQAVHLQEARERSDQAMAAVMAGWKAVSGQGSFKKAAEAGAVARDAYAQTALGKQITDVKQRAGQMAGTVAQSFQDRMDYLAHTKGAFVGELFEPGIKDAKQGLDVFVGDLGHFVGEAGNALLHLDFNGVAKAAVDFGGNAAAAFKQIAGGLSSASLSMVAFGFYSLLSLSPITLALGGLTIAALAVATNFLGMRHIVFGLAKMALGATMALFSLGQAIFGIGQGLGMIARGILNLNFDLIKQGTLRVWDAIKQGAIGLKDALAKIFSGFGETIKGVFQGIGQIILAPFGGVKIAFSAIASSARFLGGTLRSIISGPKQLWQDFLELLEKIKVRIISVTESIGDSAVGRLVRGVKKKVGGQPSDSKDVTTASAPVPVPVPVPVSVSEQKKGFFSQVFGRGTAATTQETPIPIADTTTPVSAPAPEQKKGFFGRVFGRGTAATAQEAPIPIADTNTPVSAPAPEQKKGFFGRVFGRGTAAATQKAPIPIADTTTPAPISDSQPGIQQVLGGLFSQSSAPTKSQEVLEQTKDGLNSASNALYGLGRVASLVSPGLAEPIQGLSELIGTLSGFCDITSFAQKAIPVVTAVLGNLGLIFNALKAQILGFIIPLIPAIIPILPIIAAIAVAAGLLYLAFKTNFLGIGDFIGGVIDAFKTFLGTLFGGAWDAIASVFTTFGNSLGNIWNALVELGNKIIQPFQPLLNLFGGGSDGFFGSFIKNVVNGILLPLRLMVVAINTAVNILGFVITLVIQIGNFFTTLWLIPIQLVMNGLGTLFGFFSNIFSIVMSIGKAIADFVINPLNALGNAVGGIASFFGIGGGNNSPEEVGNLQTFHSGGLISGSGETLVKARAGEFVVTPEATRSNLGVLRAINAGQNIQSIAGTAASSALSVLSPILPQIPEAPEGAARTEKEGGGSSEAGGQTFVYSINIENLTIHTSGETSEQMAADMFEALRPHLLQLHRESGRHNVTYLR